MTTDIFCIYLQNRLIQTSQTGGQRYNDTSPLSIPCSRVMLQLVASFTVVIYGHYIFIVQATGWVPCICLESIDKDYKYSRLSSTKAPILSPMPQSDGKIQIILKMSCHRYL